MRAAIPITVAIRDAEGDLKPVQGASVTVRRRSDNSAAAVYDAETGGTNVGNVLSTNIEGRVTGWVERGAYNLEVSGTGITTYVRPWDATPGADGGVDPAWLAPAAVPIGIVVPYAGTADPAAEWLIADGRLLVRANYSALFSAIGTAFNIGGEAATDFRLPDLRGRLPVGKGTHVEVDTVGETEGAALADRRVRHAHTVNKHRHWHVDPVGQRLDRPQLIGPYSVNRDVAGDGPYTEYLDAPGLANGIDFNIVAADNAGERHRTWASNESPGTDAQGPSYIVLNYVIRAR